MISPRCENPAVGALPGGTQLGSGHSGPARRQGLRWVPVRVAARRRLAACCLCSSIGTYWHLTLCLVCQRLEVELSRCPLCNIQAPEAERLLREARVQRGRQPFFGQRAALHVLLVGDRHQAEQLLRVRPSTSDRADIALIHGRRFARKPCRGRDHCPACACGQLLAMQLLKSVGTLFN